MRLNLQTKELDPFVAQGLKRICYKFSLKMIIIYILRFTYVDLDPCIEVTCDYHAICKAFRPYDARCVCIDSCPSYQEPICSSNGTSYDNTCLFKQEMCLLQLNYTVQHPGSCEGTRDLVIYGLNCHLIL